MINVWLLCLFPFFTAFVGWLIAKLVVFIYTKAVSRKKQQIITAIGKYAEQQFSLDAVAQQLTEPAQIEKILPFAEEQIDYFLRVKLPIAMPMLAMFISDKLVADMKAIFMNELKDLIPALIQQYLAGIKKEVSISNMISTKLAAISTEAYQPVLRKQLRVVDYACIITGFVTGGLYILLTWIA